MNNLTVLELVSLLASIASLVLAVIAIWLSFVFFKMSSELTDKSTEAAKGISSGVEKLEKLFDKLYADTFSMMRETVSDMRRHMWPEPDADAEKIAKEAEERAEQKISVLRAGIEQDLGRVLQRQKMTDEKIASLTGEMTSLLNKAIEGSRQLEAQAREETIRDALLSWLRNERVRRPDRVAVVNGVVDTFGSRFPLMSVFEELLKMRAEGVIELLNRTDQVARIEDIEPSTTIRLLSVKGRER